jgi:hypothetical protein
MIGIFFGMPVHLGTLITQHQTDGMTLNETSDTNKDLFYSCKVQSKGRFISVINEGLI